MKTTARSILSALVFLSAGLATKAEEPAKEPAIAPSTPYIFQPIKIEASPVDGEYTGRFRFVNQSPKPVEIYGWARPDHGKFEPMYLGFEIQVNGAWVELRAGYCTTGAETFPMDPQVPCEFICDLSHFDEQEPPLTARICLDSPTDTGFVEFKSESFILDWKKDRANGAFTAARKQNFEKARAIFSKAGFKPALIQGDDFCERLLQSMVTATAAEGFTPFKGRLGVTPSIELDGTIIIDFSSEEDHEVYQGVLRLNPREFNPAWFRKEVRNLVEVHKHDDGSLQVESNDWSWVPELGKKRFALSLDYSPSDKAPEPPTPEQAKGMFIHMLDCMDPWLEDGPKQPHD